MSTLNLPMVKFYTNFYLRSNFHLLDYVTFYLDFTEEKQRSFIIQNLDERIEALTIIIEFNCLNLFQKYSNNSAQMFTIN